MVPSHIFSRYEEARYVAEINLANHTYVYVCVYI